MKIDMVTANGLVQSAIRTASEQVDHGSRKSSWKHRKNLYTKCGRGPPLGVTSGYIACLIVTPGYIVFMLTELYSCEI